MSALVRAGRRWTWLNLLLGALILAVLAYLVVLLSVGASALPGTTSAERAEQQYSDVSAAARNGIGAFLVIDYRNMDPLMTKVLDNATGDFYQQYSANKSGLKLSATQQQAVSSGKVRQVGISEVSGKSATVFVAADAVVSNKQTHSVKATKACPHAGSVCRYYRFQLGMTRTPQGWKISKLDFVS